MPFSLSFSILFPLPFPPIPSFLPFQRGRFNSGSTFNCLSYIYTLLFRASLNLNFILSVLQFHVTSGLQNFSCAPHKLSKTQCGHSIEFIIVCGVKQTYLLWYFLISVKGVFNILII